MIVFPTYRFIPVRVHALKTFTFDREPQRDGMHVIQTEPAGDVRHCFVWFKMPKKQVGFTYRPTTYLQHHDLMQAERMRVHFLMSSGRMYLPHVYRVRRHVSMSHFHRVPKRELISPPVRKASARDDRSREFA